MSKLHSIIAATLLVVSLSSINICTALTLTWDAVTTNTDNTPATITGYTVYYRTNTAALWQPVSTTSDTTTTATVTTNIGEYSVTATSDLNLESDNSNIVSTKKPNKPVITKITK